VSADKISRSGLDPALLLLLSSPVLGLDHHANTYMEDTQLTGRQFVNLSDANLQALLLGIGSVLALTLPFLYLASLRNTGGSSNTGGYGGYGGYQQQRKFNIFNPLMPRIESPWRDQQAQAKKRDSSWKPAEFLEAGYKSYSQ